ncbi:AAA family ATPase, partial [Acinetobacter baumannii]
MSDALPPRPDHVLPGLPRGQVGIAISTGHAGKSFLLLEAALAVATGADIGGLWQEPVTAGPTYYICGTDPREIVKVRLANVLASDGG